MAYRWRGLPVKGRSRRFATPVPQPAGAGPVPPRVTRQRVRLLVRPRAGDFQQQPIVGQAPSAPPNLSQFLSRRTRPPGIRRDSSFFTVPLAGQAPVAPSGVPRMWTRRRPSVFPARRGGFAPTPRTLVSLPDAVKRRRVVLPARHGGTFFTLAPAPSAPVPPAVWPPMFRTVQRFKGVPLLIRGRFSFTPVPPIPVVVQEMWRLAMPTIRDRWTMKGSLSTSTYREATVFGDEAGLFTTAQGSRSPGSDSYGAIPFGTKYIWYGGHVNTTDDPAVKDLWLSYGFEVENVSG